MADQLMSCQRRVDVGRPRRVKRDGGRSSKYSVAAATASDIDPAVRTKRVPSMRYPMFDQRSNVAAPSRCENVPNVTKIVSAANASTRSGRSIQSPRLGRWNSSACDRAAMRCRPG